MNTRERSLVEASLWKLKKWVKVMAVKGQILSRTQTIVGEALMLAEVMTRKWDEGRQKSMLKLWNQKKLGRKEIHKVAWTVSLHLAQSSGQEREAKREAMRILNYRLLSTLMVVKVDPILLKVRKASEVKRVKSVRRARRN